MFENRGPRLSDATILCRNQADALALKVLAKLSAHEATVMIAHARTAAADGTHEALGFYAVSVLAQVKLTLRATKGDPHTAADLLRAAAQLAVHFDQEAARCVAAANSGTP